MKKRVCIYTLNGNDNYGNKLQNYALVKYIESFGFSVFTIWLENSLKKIKRILQYISYILLNKKRRISFLKFNKYLNYIYKNKLNFSNKIDYFIVGSDQVWNCKFAEFDSSYLLNKVESSKRISYAASFAIDVLPENYKTLFLSELIKFKCLSVREFGGKKIINDLNKDLDVKVVIDPTMLLTADEWDNVSLKPKMLKNDKFILNYFLGKLSEDKRNEIERVAQENNCEIINILDKNSPFYECGPSEFLWLEKHAFLICTDSFHSSVFAVLYNRPFIIFDREQEGMAKMNSRLDTLISKFNLKNRKFEGKITQENLNHDYSETYRILEIERQKSKDFLERALDIKK